MELRYQTFEGEIFSVNSKDVQDILPYQGVLRLPLAKPPYQGLMMNKGQLLPVLGPIPSSLEIVDSPNYDERPWVIVYKSHAQVVAGLPEIFEPKAS